MRQIKAKKRSVVFSFSDLIFPSDKLGHVAVVLSDLCKTGDVIRLEKGAYYKPCDTSHNPCLAEHAIVTYITSKHKGYVTGHYAYNQLGLTQGRSPAITIASSRPVRRMEINGLKFFFVKTYVNNPSVKDVGLVYILDAIKDIKMIPGRTVQDVYDAIKSSHIKELSPKRMERLVCLSQKYPPRVRKILGDMLDDLREGALRDRVVQSLCPTTRYVQHYTKS